MIVNTQEVMDNRPELMLYAVERAIASLDAQAKKLAEAGNYDCMFFESDADQLRLLRENLVFQLVRGGNYRYARSKSSPT